MSVKPGTCERCPNIGFFNEVVSKRFTDEQLSESFRQLMNALINKGECDGPYREQILGDNVLFCGNEYDGQICQVIAEIENETIRDNIKIIR